MSVITSIVEKKQWQAYLELCKPRVVALMLLTALVGMLLSTPSTVPLQPLFFGMLGIALSAASAAVINHLVDHRIDAIMGRTRRRPLPTGRISPQQAIIFAGVLGLVGMIILVLFVNLLTAALTFLTLIGYAGIYTLYLKRATPQNIVIGGLAGAAPPLLGWTAITGHVDANSLLLVLIIFIWTPPHFWALAIFRYQDYARAEIPMLPVTHGIQFTKVNILLYTVLLIAASVFPYITSMSGWVYLCGALILGAGFLYYAIKLLVSQNNKIALNAFRYSIYYLMLLFIILLVDHYEVML